MSILDCVCRKLSLFKGNLRFWEENPKLLLKAGFSAGDRILVSLSRGRLEIIKSDDGRNHVSCRKSTNSPIIDLSNKKLSSAFKGAKSVFVEFYAGKIVVVFTKLVSRSAQRLEQIRRKLKKGIPLGVASLFIGMGGLDYSVANAMASKGVNTNLEWANEIDVPMLELSLKNNPVWEDQSKAFGIPLQEFSPIELGLKSPDILLAGIPCVSHSSMQTNPWKRGVFHPTSGLLFVDILRVIKEANPAVILFEQSPNFVKQDTSPESFNSQHVDYYVITRYLAELGYHVSHKFVSGDQHGMLEKRKRTLLVATTKGLEFDLSNVEPPESPQPKALGHYLTPFNDVPEKAWSEMPYLSRKTRETSNNFSETLVTEQSTSIPVFTATYTKRQPNTPIIVNKDMPHLKRLASAAEHARIKHYPESMIMDASETLGHRALGNSVQKDVFSYYASKLAEHLLQAVNDSRQQSTDSPMTLPHLSGNQSKPSVEAPHHQDSQLTLFT